RRVLCSFPTRRSSDLNRKYLRSSRGASVSPANVSRERGPWTEIIGSWVVRCSTEAFSPDAVSRNQSSMSAVLIRAQYFWWNIARSEEHTSELQSLRHL